MTSLTWPLHPADQHELTWWEVNLDGIQEYRALYHKNTPWSALFKDDGDGADFVDEVQLFLNGQFIKRYNNKDMRIDIASSMAYASRAEAVEGFRRRLLARQQHLTAELARIEAQLRELPQ